MTNKNPGKSEPAGQAAAGKRNEDMQTAYLVHTLAQMLYGQLATTHPWLATPYVQTSPYVTAHAPFPVHTAPYPTPSMPYAAPQVPHWAGAFSTPSTPYAMPNVGPQQPFEPQHTLPWAPYYAAYCGFTPGWIR